MKIVILFFIISIISAACAKPTYLSNKDSSNLLNSKNNYSCTLIFLETQLCVQVEWIKNPTETEPGELLIKTYRENKVDQSPILENISGNLSVVLWMPSMGHGSSPVQVTQGDTGTYLGKNVFFIMPGEWQIKFQIKENDIVKDETILDIRI